LWAVIVGCRRGGSPSAVNRNLWRRNRVVPDLLAAIEAPTLGLYLVYNEGTLPQELAAPDAGSASTARPSEAAVPSCAEGKE